ncbi:hypothetical protein NDU88_009429 [Pleurodeles waltl]|uniref:Uncharacterized protein n=1 Tax=Pleurodeles waltl TaxID=8319 RepID=A0AAV7PSF7_PLEWA|nr:hypothetical protein NDU88_009429 [Pleurodeles waltl]
MGVAHLRQSSRVGSRAAHSPGRKRGIRQETRRSGSAKPGTLIAFFTEAKQHLPRRYIRRHTSPTTGRGHRLKSLTRARAAGRVQNPDNTPALCPTSELPRGRRRVHDRGLRSLRNASRHPRTCIDSRVSDHSRRLSRVNNCCSGEAVGGSAFTGARVCAPATAPASHAACGLPCDRICIHIRGRETREDESCRATARFSHCTRGRPGGRAAVISIQLVGPRAAPHFRPRFGAAALDKAAPL